MTEPQSQTKSNRFMLTGNSTYIPWLSNLENKSAIMDWCILTPEETIIYPDEINPEIPSPSATQKALLSKKVLELKTYILESIDPSKVQVQMKFPIRKILADLARNYGACNIDASNFKVKLPGKVYFDPLKNPLATFRWLHNQNSLLKVAGNALTNAEFKVCVEIGLEPPEITASSNTHFWFNVYSKIKELEVVPSPDELELQAMKFWKTYQSQIIVEKQMLIADAKEPVRPGFSMANANLAGLEHANNRFCKSCSENGREKVMKTHNLNNCRFKDFKGTGFPPKAVNGQSNGRYSSQANAAESMNSGVSAEQFQALVALVKNLANKEGQNYFHDTGATPTSFVNVKPKEFTPNPGKVGTAGVSSYNTLGTGTIKFGNIKLDATFVPSFTKKPRFWYRY